MGDILGILNIGAGALQAHQEALQVTGQNIANVNTPGYSRRQVVLTSGVTQGSVYGGTGTGVKVAEVQRIYDRFIAGQIGDEQGALGRWDTQMELLERTEMALGVSSGNGLEDTMSAFWNSWEDVVNNPGGRAERATLVANSENLVETFTMISAEWSAIQQDINSQITTTVEQVNTITEQIADLNGRIAMLEANGNDAGGFLDQRDGLVTDLSSLIDVNTFAAADGQLNIMTAGGTPLVDHSTVWTVTHGTDASGNVVVGWGEDGGSTPITDQITTGSLKGLVEVRDVIIPDYQAGLDTLAAGIMTAVNAIHGTGYGLTVDPATVDPITNPTGTAYTGVAFFVGTGAADMTLNPLIAEDVDIIAAAQDPDALPGDNSNALAIAGLETSFTMGGPPGTMTFSEFYRGLVSEVGNDVRKAVSASEHHTATAEYLETFRESVSGVSLDEEMVNLVKFQHAYEAAAKLVSTVDEMLMSVLDMV